MEDFVWEAVGEFRNRDADLAVLQDWWEGPSREPINLFGRRRVGKSWLFRKLAHGKPAVVLVAHEAATPALALRRCADALTPVLGVRPELRDVADLFEVIYQLGKTDKVLVVIDEFPYLLGGSASGRRAVLTTIQSVMEQHRDSSQTKLLLAGSLVAEMERLQEPKSPLYGRLRPFELRPLDFADALALISTEDPIDSLTRYAVAGGMPRYLSEFGSGDLAGKVIARVLDRRGGLFNEPVTLLQHEVRAPATYLAILAALSGGGRMIGDVAASLSMTSSELTPYLQTLRAMRLVEKASPVGARGTDRKALWRCSDHFVRFWFRFVRPYQDELEAGADAAAYWKAEVRPQLASHSSSVFEEVLRTWIRSEFAGEVTEVGSWWGNSLNSLRRAKVRTTEEIDAVAVRRSAVVVAAEAKWTNQPVGADVLADLRDYKLPAMEQAGFETDGTRILLASRSGFTAALKKLAAQDPAVELIEAATVIRGVGGR